MGKMASSSVPLHCSVCPKKPNFSDVSHLLTHVASKGHLSHYYKLRISSGQNTSSRQQLDQYDLWYSTHNIESLMAERMQHKEKNRPRARGKAPKPRSRKSSSKNTSLPLDPRLNGHPASKSETPISFGHTEILSPPTLPYYEQPPTPTRHRPKLHLWSTQEPTSYKAIAIEFSSPKYGPLEVHAGPFAAHFHPSLSPHGVDLDNLDDEDDELAGEAAKLKGICWPGMDIFDSATPEMRRKRNQKKDVSVVEQLEQNSQEVQPTEMIFFPFGDLKKQRKISGRVEFSSSPEIPPKPKPSPPKRRTSKKQLLADRDVNTQSKRLLSAPAVNKKKDNGCHPLAKPKARQIGKKPKKSFSVFKDQQQGQFGSQTGMNVLTSEFRPPQNHSNQQHQDYNQEQRQPPAPSNVMSGYHQGSYSEMFSFGPFEGHSHQHCHQHPHGEYSQQNSYNPMSYDLAALLTAHLQTYHSTMPGSGLESSCAHNEGPNGDHTVSDRSMD